MNVYNLLKKQSAADAFRKIFESKLKPVPVCTSRKVFIGSNI